MDHEYEPITPMSTTRLDPPAPILKVANTEPQNVKTENTSKPKEAQFLKIPNEDEIVKAEEEYDVEEEEDLEDEEEEFDEELEEEEEEDMSEDPGDEFEDDDEEMTAEELQARMEEKFFQQASMKYTDATKANTLPSTSSHSVPLRSSLKRDTSPQPQSFQEKLKSKADRFKTKLQTMSKRKEASKSNEEGDNEDKLPPKSRFQLPKRPKFDTSKFKLPDKARLRMPDRSKFKMPDRPKFKMPDKSKFKMPDRPKFHMPDTSKFKLPDRPKFPTLKLPKRSNSFKEPQNGTATSNIGSKKNLFDFSTIPRVFSKRKREEVSGEPETDAGLKPTSVPTSSSAPSTPRWSRANLTQKWSQMITELKTKQEGNKKFKATNDKSRGRSSSTHTDKGYSMATSSLDDSRARSTSSGLDTDKEQCSSGASSLRERKGVLEEINSDEFFLREKGLSRDNVDVSQFLTREIRDAFKADKENEGSEFEEEEPSQQEEVKKQATPPQRSKSFSRFISRFHKKEKKELQEKKDQYKTYPPRKADRKRRESELFVIIPLKDENDPDFAPSIPVNDHTDEDYEVQRQMFKAVTKPKLDTLSVPEGENRLQSPTDQTKPSSKASSPAPSFVSYVKEDKENVQPITEVVIAQVETFPSAPKRRKSVSASLKSEGILKDVESNKDNRSLKSEIIEPDRRSNIDPQPEIRQYPTPVAPRRRSRSLGASLTSEDRTSRGADSMPSEETGETCDYAIVDKSIPPETPPRSRPPRPPPPCRRRRTFNMIRDQGLSYFFTVPRRKSYVEEIPTTEKSYSTLGPTRPPRRAKVFREPLYADGSVHSIQSEIGYIDNDSETKSLNQHIQDFTEDFKMDISIGLEDKDLQSEDVIEKMKGRPLPAPPRPPRKSRQDGEEDSDIEEIEKDAKILGTTPPIVKIAQNLAHEDVSIAIQTDPLSDDYIVKNNDTKEDNTKADKPREIPLKGERKSLQGKKTQQDPSNDEINNFDAPTLPLRNRTTPKDKLKEIKPSNIDQNNLIAPIHPVAPINEARIQTTSFSVLVSPVTPITVNHAPTPHNSTSCRETTPQPNETPRPPARQDSSHRPPSRRRGSNDSKHTIERVVERQVVVVPGPETEVKVLKAQKLQIQELDVSKINVSELQASKITVHDVDSDVVNVSRINSSSGNLVIDNIELPSDILQSISQSITGAISFSNATMSSPRSQVQDQSAQACPSQESTQSQTQATPSTNESTQTKSDTVHKDKPETSREHSADYAVPVPKYYRRRNYSFDSEDEVMIVPIPLPRSRRRHYPSSDHQKSTAQPFPSCEPEDSALDLGRRLINVISSDIASLIHTFLQQLPRGEKQQQHDVVHMFICIFIAIFALFFLMGFGSGSKTIHTHHWDYQFPPPPP